MDIKIVFHPSGDWEGLYLEGELKCEGHSIQVEDLVSAFNTMPDNLFTNRTTLFEYTTRDLGNEEGFDAEDFSFPLKYEDINNGSNKM